MKWQLGLFLIFPWDTIGEALSEQSILLNYISFGRNRFSLEFPLWHCQNIMIKDPRSNSRTISMESIGSVWIWKCMEREKNRLLKDIEKLTSMRRHCCHQVKTCFTPWVIILFWKKNLCGYMPMPRCFPIRIQGCLHPWPWNRRWRPCRQILNQHPLISSRQFLHCRHRDWKNSIMNPPVKNLSSVYLWYFKTKKHTLNESEEELIAQAGLMAGTHRKFLISSAMQIYLIRRLHLQTGRKFGWIQQIIAFIVKVRTAMTENRYFILFLKR